MVSPMPETLIEPFFFPSSARNSRGGELENPLGDRPVDYRGSTQGQLGVPWRFFLFFRMQYDFKMGISHSHILTEGANDRY